MHAAAPWLHAAAGFDVEQADSATGKASALVAPVPDETKILDALAAACANATGRLYRGKKYCSACEAETDAAAP